MAAARHVKKARSTSSMRKRGDASASIASVGDATGTNSIQMSREDIASTKRRTGYEPYQTLLQPRAASFA